FNLRFNGATTAAPLTFGATAAQVRTALTGLATIGANGVSVARNTVYSGISEVQKLALTNPAGVGPTLNTAVVSANGAFAAGNYYYVVTAILAGGETAPSNELGPIVVAANQQVTLNWTAPAGVTPLGYRVYRATAAGIYTSPSLVTTLGAVTSYVDTGTALVAGAPPVQTVFRLTFDGTNSVPITY